MKYETKIKDERGTLLVEVFLWVCKHDWEKDFDGNTFRYDVITTLTLPNKRKPEVGNYNHLLTDEEIFRFKKNLWDSIRPDWVEK